MILLPRPTDSARLPAKAQYRALGADYWRFFAVAFFFDAGFAVYFFLFNLYLLDAHWNEASIGLVTGAFTLGSLLATLPAGEIASRFGIRTLLLACIVSAPLLGITRALWLGPSAQLLSGFFAGAAMGLWGVGYLAAIARVVPSDRRPAAYSLIFTASVITSAIGAAICGFLPQWIAQRGIWLPALQFKRAALLLSCCIAMIGIVPLLRLRLPAAGTSRTRPSTSIARWRLTPFLRRYLPCMALWAAVIAAFSPFSNIYLVHQRHMPLHTIAVLFSCIQVLQLVLGVGAPHLLRVLGLHRGLLLIQLSAAAMLAMLAIAPTSPLCAAAYIGFSAAQWISMPALYSTLMNETPVTQHENAAALTLFVTALLGTIATPLAGAAFTQLGYTRTLLALSAIALATAMLFYRLGQRPTQPADHAELCPVG